MESKDNFNESNLFSRVQKGDVKAFETLYAHYFDALFGYCMKFLNNEEDSEEIIQNLFLKIWEGRHKFYVGDSFKSFLFKIAVNDIYNFLKHKKHEANYRNYFEYSAKPFSNSTEEKVFYNELEQQIDTLIAQLPEQRRKIFILNRKEGHSTQDIAKEMNLSKRTVENQLFRAIKFLRDKLDIPTFLF